MTAMGLKGKTAEMGLLPRQCCWTKREHRFDCHRKRDGALFKIQTFCHHGCDIRMYVATLFI